MVFNQIDVGGLISLLGQLKVRCFGFNMIDICGMIDIFGQRHNSVVMRSSPACVQNIIPSAKGSMALASWAVVQL